jgi:hypothetical protein
MNKNIKELAEQAWVFANNQYDVPKPQIMRFQEKFAELIVKECITMCVEAKDDYFKHRIATFDFGEKNIYAEGEAASDVIKRKIKKHFGVKK